ncbi:MAG: hypothetical protein KGI25_05765 [Thaumarchaeota archaeon]|nr:hypothetical protein [Nitrososphaerota archaeon]
MCDKIYCELYMIRQSKNPINLKMIIFICIYAAMIAFSLAWYNALTGIDCTLTNTKSDLVKVNSSGDGTHNCNEQLHFHWIKFYGINGLSYGASAFVLVANARKRNRN